MKNIRKCIIGLFEYLRQNGIVLLLLALLAVILFGGMTGIMYSTDDEVSCYYRLHSGLSGNVLSVAKAQGRFYFLLSQFMAAVPFLIKNVVWYKLWAYGAVLFNMLLVWYLIRKYIGELPAYLTILCFLGFYELNMQHNLLVAYPFFLQQPLTGVLLSTEFFLRYQCEKKEIFAAASALAFLYACMFNESFLSFGIIIAVIALRGCNSGWKGIRQWCRSIKYHIAAGVLYFAVYVLFRRLFHSTYGGNVIGESYTILQRFQTMLALMTGQSPLKSYRHLLTAGNKLNVSVLSVLKGGAAAFCCVHLLTRLYKHSGRTDDESINKEMYAYGTAVTLLVLFSLLLTLPYSLTDRYSKQILTGHIYSYVVSYYSFWFMAAAFCILPIKSSVNSL